MESNIKTSHFKKPRRPSVIRRCEKIAKNEPLCDNCNFFEGGSCKKQKNAVDRFLFDLLMEQREQM